jgi:predicted YcjX-like family ATPase
MQQITDERLNDSLIGDAVLRLLRSGKPVTVAELIKQLQEIADSSDSEIIKQACERNIVEIRHSRSSTQQTSYRNYDVRDKKRSPPHYR